jgi:hypothetical protein
MKWKVVIVTIIVVILGLAAVIFIPIIRNNIILHNFAKQLYNLSLPSDTVILLREKNIGHFGSSRSQITFFACVEIESSLSIEELTTYYSDKMVNPANEVSRFKLKTLKTIFNEAISEKREPVQIEILQKKTAYRSTYSKGPYVKRVDIDDSINENLFIIQIHDGMYNPGWDIRAQ